MRADVIPNHNVFCEHRFVSLLWELWRKLSLRKLGVVWDVEVFKVKRRDFTLNWLKPAYVHNLARIEFVVDLESRDIFANAVIARGFGTDWRKRLHLWACRCWIVTETSILIRISYLVFGSTWEVFGFGDRDLVSFHLVIAIVAVLGRRFGRLADWAVADVFIEGLIEHHVGVQWIEISLSY